MTFVRLDDGFPEHPKVFALKDSALALYVRALCYAHRQRTDGHISAAYVGRKRTAAAELVAARLWVEDPENGWQIWGYLDWYPSRAELEDRTKRAAEAGRRGAEKRWGTDGGTP